MISSYEVAALMAAQQQQMAAMQTRPGTIGFSPTPGPSQYPPSFSYGPSGGPGYSGGGATMAGAVGAASNAVLPMAAGAGVASLFTSSRLIHGMSMLDPTSGLWAAGNSYLGGASLGRAAMVGTGVGAAALAAVEGIRYSGNQFVRGATDQSQVGATLGQSAFFANATARGGRGFSTAQEQMIGNALRAFDRSDPFTTMGDTNRLLGTFSDMKMAQGVRDAEEFAKRFTKMADTVKTMAKTMGSSLDEASQVFSGMRQAGFYSSRDVLGNTQSMQVARGLGMSTNDYLSMQFSGASLSRSMGMTGAAGALSTSRMAERIMIGSQMGMLSDTNLMDMTGTTSVSDASISLGQDISGSLGRFLTNSGMGRALLMSIGSQDASGSYTGAIDTGRLQSFVSGGIGVQDLSGIAQGRLGGGRNSRLSFTTRTQDIGSSLMESGGGMDAIVQLVKGMHDLPQYRDLDDDAFMELVLQQQMGMDRRTSQILKRLIEEHASTRRQAYETLQREIEGSRGQSEIAMSRSVRGIGRQISGGFSDAVGGPIRQAGAGFLTNVSLTGEMASDTVFGITRYNSAGVSSDVTTRLALGQGLDQNITGLTPGQALGGLFAPALTGVLSPSSYRESMGVARLAAAGLTRRMGGGAQNPEYDALLQTAMADPSSLRDASFGLDSGQLSSVQGLAHSLRGDATYQKLLVAATREADAGGPGLLGTSDRRRLRDYVASRVTGPGTDQATAEAMTAYAMSQAGAEHIVANLLPGGSSRDILSLTAAQERMRAGLSRSGLTNETKQTLIEGGTGAGLLSALARKEGSNAYGAFMAVMAKYANLPETDRYEAVAQALSSRYGIPVTAGDVQSVASLASELDSTRRSFGSAVGLGSSVEAKFAEIGTLSGSLGDAAVRAEISKGAVAAFGTANGDLRRALGSDFTAAQRAMATGEGVASAFTEGGAFERLLNRVDQVGAARVGSLDPGFGGALQSLSEARTAGRAARNTASLARAFGMSETQVSSFLSNLSGVSAADGLSAVEAEKASNALARMQGSSLLSSAGAGGMFFGGESVESNLAWQLQQTADSVRRMSEGVSGLMTHMEQTGLIERVHGSRDQ